MKDLVRFMENDIPFNAWLGLKVEHAAEGAARMRMPYRAELVGDARRPALHGGVVGSLLDATGGLAAWTLCTVEDRIATVDIRIDYLLPAPVEDIFAEAQVQRMGNRVAAVAMRAFSGSAPDRSVAEGRAVYNVRRR